MSTRLTSARRDSDNSQSAGGQEYEPGAIRNLRDHYSKKVGVRQERHGVRGENGEIHYSDANTWHTGNTQDCWRDRIALQVDLSNAEGLSGSVEIKRCQAGFVEALAFEDSGLGCVEGNSSNRVARNGEVDFTVAHAFHATSYRLG